MDIQKVERALRRGGDALVVGLLGMVLATWRHSGLGLALALLGTALALWASHVRTRLAVVVYISGMAGIYFGALWEFPESTRNLAPLATILTVPYAFYLHMTREPALEPQSGRPSEGPLVPERGGDRRSESNVSREARRRAPADSLSALVHAAQPEIGGRRSVRRQPLWSVSRYRGRPGRVHLGWGVLSALAGVLGAVAALDGRNVDAILCAVSAGTFVVSVGIRNPLGAIPALLGTVVVCLAGFTGVLSELAPMAAVAASILIVFQIYWRRDNE